MGPNTQQSWQPRVLISAPSRCCKPGVSEGVTHTYVYRRSLCNNHWPARKDTSGSRTPFVHVEFSVEIVNKALN